MKVEIKSILPKWLLEGREIVKLEERSLNIPGENWSCSIVGVDLFLKTKTKEEVISLVAKVLPSSDFVLEFGNTRFTFRNELKFFEHIIPCLRNFRSLDIFPKFYGGRLSLDPAAYLADDDAVILLENLKSSDYKLEDNFVGFDSETSRLILSKLAEFHAAALAMKLTQPDIFQEKIMSLLEKFKLRQIQGQDIRTLDSMIETVLQALKSDSACAPYLKKIQTAIESCVKKLRLEKNTPDELNQSKFSALIHGDLWTNNIMVRKTKGIEVKFIDFQTFEYSSVAQDVIFFVFSSVSEAVLRRELDELIMFYHSELIQNLEEINCDTTGLGSEDFEREMKKVGQNISFLNVLIPMMAFFPNVECTLKVEDNSEDSIMQLTNLSEYCKRRMILTAREFIRKQWL